MPPELANSSNTLIKTVTAIFIMAGRGPSRVITRTQNEDE
jgi:hypothetical protein